MYVGGALLHGALDQQIDESDDRGFAGLVAQPLDVGIGLTRRRLPGVAGKDLDRGRVAVEPVQRRLDLSRRREAELDRPCGREPQRIGHEGIERIGHRDHGALVIRNQRHRLGLAQEPGTQRGL
jgi:hypothetical protein